MIKLFNIPNHKIDTAQFSNLLHDRIVQIFEHNLADYVGAKHCVTFNSATSAIFLLMSWIKQNFIEYDITIPALIPPVVPNAIINAGVKYTLVDNAKWMGGRYSLLSKPLLGRINIYDSAHRLYRDQFKLEGYGNSDLVIYSFYPTKPVGSCDGGAIVSNDSGMIDYLRKLSHNGMINKTPDIVGHKMYMNSIQAYIANENLKLLDEKTKVMGAIKKRYESAFDGLNTGKTMFDKSPVLYCSGMNHLFIVRLGHYSSLKNNSEQIELGHHYPLVSDYKIYAVGAKNKSLSAITDLVDSFQGNFIVSIPFHEALTDEEIETVIKYVNSHAE